MTGRAGQSCVLTGKWKRCLGVVVELPYGPVVWRMTIRAGRAQPAGVNVVLGMTIDARLSCIVKEERLVTRAARGARVQADKREAS